ncbi:MAG: OmpA family protein [Thermodesulfobacteriota bacterium]
MINLYGSHGKRIFALLCIGLIVLAGCAAGPEANPQYQRAQTAYQEAKAMEGVMENAQVPMYEAGKALDRAAGADDQKDISRLSTMAEKQVDYAVAVAEQKMAEQKIESLKKEEQKVLLDTRQRQIEQAKREAEAKARESEMKAREAEEARRQAEEAQTEALTMKQEADKARQDAEAKALEAELAREEIETLRRQMAELEAEKTERGLVLTLGDVLFETGKADLMPGAMRSIDKLARFLQENPEREVLVEGHTDSVGSESYNLNLSQRRAESAATALTARGIGADRITTRGYGEAYPEASNATQAGRQQNRRVEIVILEEGVAGETMIRQ